MKRNFSPIGSPVAPMCCTAMLLTWPAAAQDGKGAANLDFESGKLGAVPAGWILPPVLAKAGLKAVLSEDEPSQGRQCVVLSGTSTDPQQAPFGNLLQSINAEPWRGKHLTLSAQVRTSSPGQARLWIRADLPSGKMGPLDNTGTATQPTWHLCEAGIDVPAEAESITFGLMAFGGATAAADDFKLEAAAPGTAAVRATLAVAYGWYAIEPTGGTASVTCSVPFPTKGQTPLALRAETVPPGLVESLEIGVDRENRPLRITLKPTARGRTKIEVRTLALLREHPAPDLSHVPLAVTGKLPPDVRLHLKPAPGIAPGHKLVRAAAEKIGTESVGQALGDLAGWLKTGLAYEGGQSQMAEDCLRSGKAVCTGYANTAASMLIARGLPARVLACVPLGGKCQEHYIIDAWAGPAAGWRKLESTAGTFPWSDGGHLTVRIVYPDAPRSPFGVPLFVKVDGGTGGFDGDSATGCWQEGRVAGNTRMAPPVLAAVESAAQQGFAAVEKKRQKAAAFRCLPPGKGGTPAAAVEAAITTFLQETR